MKRASHLHPVWRMALASLALAGCATPPGQGVATASKGPGSVSLTLAPRAFKALDATTAHSWTPNDVYEYDVSLLIKNEQGQYVALNPAVSTVLSQHGGPALSAQFTGLAAGMYEASVIAKGDVNAIDNLKTLTANAAVADIDLTSAKEATATVNVTLDPVDFDPTASTTLALPDRDGQWLSPSASPTVNFGQ